MQTTLATSAVGSLSGDVADGAHWLRDAELRPLTGIQEEWLLCNPKAPSAVSVTRLLTDCLLNVGEHAITPDRVRQLLVGDRDLLVLKLRMLMLGDEFHAVVGCPACAKRMDVSFEAADVVVEKPETIEASYEVGFNGLPTRERTICFRLPTGADQEAVLGSSVEKAVEILIGRCLIDDGGIALNAAEREQLANAIEHRAPKIDLELALTCPECNQWFLFPFDTTAFFLLELRNNSRNLLKEIHCLAFHYHWSETEILKMDRTRRRAYLSLLTDELRGD
jgi:hypothetical protein